MQYNYTVYNDLFVIDVLDLLFKQYVNLQGYNEKSKLC